MSRKNKEVNLLVKPDLREVLSMRRPTWLYLYDVIDERTTNKETKMTTKVVHRPTNHIHLACMPYIELVRVMFRRLQGLS